MNHSASAPLLADEGDTWGIPGPDFLNYYLVTAVVALAVVVWIRRSATQGASTSPEPTLDPEQVADLAGFRSQTYYTALTALRTQGAVATAGKGRIVATGVRPAQLSELQLAILAVVGPGARTSAVLGDPRLVLPMDRIRDGLRVAGLLMTPAQSARCRMAAGALLAVVLIGVARIASAVGTGHPFRNLLVVMFVLFVLGLILLAVVPARTTAGTSVLRNLRAANGHLRVSQHPAWAAYGPMGAGLSVALFGATALFAIDPAFADEVRAPRYAGSDGGSSSYGGDGGGSSGGGDSGGSSCGGGGCGGGGCGG
ncbi:uncharacterized protein (TIGR04222 family) [Nakamurella sp. UYEF19]|uniref:TIGR04222 domain-containing membrane protein n=1 Tax=Nakamurella sp. UYEF19 TaxID=1756392 RepID=UPI003397E6D3